MREVNLYKDFSLDEQNCHEEPIHRPVAIQGGTYCLIFDAKNESSLLAYSDNIEDIIKSDYSDLFKVHHSKWMPEPLLSAYLEMRNPEDWDSIDPVPMSLLGIELNLIRHIHDGVKILEFEQKPSKPVTLSSFRTIRMVTEPFKKQHTIEELFSTATQLMKKVTGYSRAMIYKFNSDFSGTVVGEAKDHQLESFLGLRYPATDIPKIARELFLKNRSRIILDVHSDVSWIKFNELQLSQGKHLDLTHSQFRATSQIHIEYLINMGVRSTFNLAIVVDGKLWGLISFHGYEAHFISYELRKTGELIANALAQRITEIENNEYNRLLVEKKEISDELFSLIDSKHDISNQLDAKEIDFTKIVDSVGFVAISKITGIHTSGVCPDSKTIKQIHQEIHKNPVLESTVFTNNVSQLFPDLDIDSSFAGMAYTHIEDGEELEFMWFKKSISEDLEWGGDPTQPYEIDYSNNGNVRLSPRRSFEKYKSSVIGVSKDWTQLELDMIDRFRDAIITKSIQRQTWLAKSLKNEMEQLTQAASHDLQEPIRTVQNYINLLRNTLNGVKNPEVEDILDRTHDAAKRMKALIRDILEYSESGIELHKEWVNISNLIDDIRLLFHESISTTGTKIEVENDIEIFWDQNELLRLFSNLISNSIKYQKPEVSPEISISMDQIDSSIIITFTDNGIGIADKFHDQIFNIFTRLHSKEEYPGTGIGLTLCQKIVNTMGGNIHVQSTEGTGTTFHISLHASMVRKVMDHY